MSVIYLMKSKSDVMDRFKEFVAMAEAHFGLKVERLRSDNGGEYSSCALKDFCKQRGMILEPTTPYTPELNGVAERLNRKLCEKTRSLLTDAEMPKSLWGEAILTAVYLTNRSPTSAIEHKTPYELWYGEKPDLSKLKVFGSPCVVHVPKEKRSKLDTTGVPAIFVGYGFNGYRCWWPEKWKVISSRDIAVNESRSEGTEVELEDDVADTVPMATVIPGKQRVATVNDEATSEVIEQTITPGKFVTSTPLPRPEPENDTDQSSLYRTGVETPTDTRTRPKRDVKQPARYMDYEMYYAAALSASAWLDDVPLRYDDTAGRDDEAE